MRISDGSSDVCPSDLESSVELRRKPAVPRVLELFDANLDCDIDRPRGHGVCGAAQRLSACRAHILHSAERNSVEPEGGRGRDGGVADVTIVHGTAVPARFYLAPFDASHGERLVERPPAALGRVCMPNDAHTRTAIPPAPDQN